MNALRSWLAHIARANVALAERLTPAAFAWTWYGLGTFCVLASAFVGSDTPKGNALLVIVVPYYVMAWANATGRITR